LNNFQNHREFLQGIYRLFLDKDKLVLCLVGPGGRNRRSFGVTQHEHHGHLITGQLSAYLDKQLTPQEQAAIDAHISTCPPCQQALVELRSTVALLRAMPSVDVPRSFTLPAPIRPVPVQAARVNTEPPRRQPVPHYRLRRAVRAVSTLAAVLGFLFILSGFLTNV